MKQACEDLSRATDKAIDIDAYRQGGLDYSDVGSDSGDGPKEDDFGRDSLEVMIGTHFEDAQNEEWTYKLMEQVWIPTYSLIILSLAVAVCRTCFTSPTGVQVLRHVGGV